MLCSVLTIYCLQMSGKHCWCCCCKSASSNVPCMRKQADYLIGEALVAAPGDRRLHLITGMIEDLKRLTAEQSNTGGPHCLSWAVLPSVALCFVSHGSGLGCT